MVVVLLMISCQYSILWLKQLVKFLYGIFNLSCLDKPTMLICCTKINNSVLCIGESWTGDISTARCSTNSISNRPVVCLVNCFMFFKGIWRNGLSWKRQEINCYLYNITCPMHIEQMFQALARDRLERLNASPSATPWTYFRVFSALLLVLSVDIFWYCKLFSTFIDIIWIMTWENYFKPCFSANLVFFHWIMVCCILHAAFTITKGLNEVM